MPSPRRGVQVEFEDSDHGDAHAGEDENVESGAEDEIEEGENVESGAESVEGENVESGAEGENVEEEEEEEGVGGDGDVDGTASSQDSHNSTLNASTLHGPPSQVSDEEDSSPSEETPMTQSDVPAVNSGSECVEDAYQAGDSQVPGAGWMGRAMMHFRNKEDKEEEKKEMKMWSLLSSIKSDLSKQFTEPIEGELWGMYSTFCRNAIEKDGEEDYLKFASARFFQSWVCKMKAEVPDHHKAGSKRTVDEVPADPKKALRFDEEDIETPAAKRPKLEPVVARGLHMAPVPVVGQQTAKAMAATKKADRLSELGGTHGQPLSNFHAYDLNEIGIPVVARPISGQHYAGKHGYTIHCSSGAAVEVLLKTRAFIVKKLSHSVVEDDAHRRGQITWSKFPDISAAWAEATRRSGF